MSDSGTLNVEVADRTGFESDTTAEGAVVEYIGDQNVTFGSSGSGVFDSFVRLQESPTESGYNTDGDLEFDTKSGAFTHSILVSDIPVISVGGVLYWELFADLNETDSTKLISLNDLEVYLTDDAEVTGYPFTGDATKVYDFAGTIQINDVNQGSGRGDLRYLIPVSEIEIPAECGYKDPDCTTYFVLYTQFGTTGGSYASDGGFEEWKVKQYPYVHVTKTATTTFTRTYQWEIDKIIFDPTENPALVNEAQNLVVTYKATVTNTGSTDSDWAAEGTITVHNPSGDTATITSVTDELTGGIDALVDCGVTFPYELPDGETLVCDYSVDLTDDTALTNTARVELEAGTVFTDTEAVTFGDPTTEVDKCVTVSDLLESGGVPIGDPMDLGSACVADSPKTFTYDRTFGPAGIPLACGDNTFDNTATLVTDDTETEDSDTESLTITVDCPEGCTLTQGYWKTHNDTFWGGAPTDETWLLLGADAENTTFFLSGQTWFQVFWTAPAGNVYYVLAHQYMAAVLNILAGANAPTEVTDAITAATALFNTTTPAQAGALKGTQKKPWTDLASTLAAYNEGLIEGFDHCTEDGTSAE